MGGNHASAAGSHVIMKSTLGPRKRHLIHHRRPVHGNEEEKGRQEEGGEEEIRQEASASRRCARSALAAVAIASGSCCLPRGGQHCFITHFDSHPTMSYQLRRAPQSETLMLRGLQFQLY